MTSPPPERSTSPVWFGVLAVAGGVYFAIPWNVMGFLLRTQGVPEDHIQHAVAAALFPTTWFFVSALVVDLGRQRRDWIIGASVIAAACIWPAIAWTNA